ncbi:alpha/beta hydrolase [Maritalea mediterranea]|uniref:Alpha/beta hydrolase n=1 Tax=Maritalea mediterranea TaxID=2909667 RepID=A0ABS9EAQ1_9HYPH|nr:alpha/beta hydrolase [Maritalea mediterranea]MCF4099964.1 alpha/beta hydrolase [Maritalea mediterranea]
MVLVFRIHYIETGDIVRILIGSLIILAVVSAALAWVVFYPPARDKALIGLSHLMAAPYRGDVRSHVYGPEPRHKLDVYPAAPSAASADKPIILFYYGGGWRMGDKPFYYFVGAALAAQGYDVVIPEYRLYPQVQFAGFMADAKRAYDWVWQEMAKESGRDIVVMGHSAGAHIAALLAYGETYRPDDAPAPSAFVGLAGPYAFNPKEWPSTQSIFADVANADLARPVHFVDDASPPSLMFHGEKDDVVKLWNQEQLSEVLAQHGVTHQSVVLSDTGHYKILFSFARPLLGQMQVRAQIEDFLSASHSSGDWRSASKGN